MRRDSFNVLFYPENQVAEELKLFGMYAYHCPNIAGKVLRGGQKDGASTHHNRHYT